MRTPRTPRTKGTPLNAGQEKPGREAPTARCSLAANWHLLSTCFKGMKKETGLREEGLFSRCTRRTGSFSTESITPFEHSRTFLHAREEKGGGNATGLSCEESINDYQRRNEKLRKEGTSSPASTS